MLKWYFQFEELGKCETVGISTLNLLLSGFETTLWSQDESFKRI